MADNRRQRYSTAQKAPSNNKQLQIDVKFDITELDLMCSYIVSDNANIRRGNVINMRNLFSIIDMNNYNGDQDRLSRIQFITKGIEARLEYNLTDGIMILNHICGGFGSSSNISDFRKLNNSEVDWVNLTVSEILKYSIIYNDVDEGLSLMTKFKSVPYVDRGSIVGEIEQWVNGLQVKFRRSRADNQDDMTFSLNGDTYIEALHETYRHLASPSNKLQFGVQALNALTGGGVQSQRVYTLLGLPGEGKSATLIDMAIQIKRYNRTYICKDPTKRPAVLLLIMENSIEETVQRIFSMCVGNDILNYTESEIYDLLKGKGNLHISNDDPIDLIIKYRPNLSIDTSYLYTMIEDLEDEGYEVICLIQDYLKRIRSADYNSSMELRLELGAVINEFKILANLKDIPVITASQLNRTATNIIDTARSNNKEDLVRMIGRSNVGESNLIIENSDWVALIAPEDNGNQRYLGMQRVKSRFYVPGELYTAYLPYINGTIKLVEDYYSLIPTHKIAMDERKQQASVDNAQGAVDKPREYNTIDNEVKAQVTENNIFANAASVAQYNMNSRIHLKEMCQIVSR